MGVFEFVLNLWIFSALASFVFWGITTYAFADWARLDRPILWAAGGAFLPVLGFIVAVIIHFSTRNGDAQLVARQSLGEDLW